MAFIKDLYDDEIRDGYLVKTDIKKVWNRQLEIWQEFDRICRKHGFTYWAGYGTLLGAVRHGGYIPWDVDIDFCMMRPDFERFFAVLQDEFQRSGIFEFKDESIGLIKISHSQTTEIDDTYYENKPQGLAIDVFALDIADDGSRDGHLAYRAFNELLFATHAYNELINAVNEGRLQLLNETDVLKKIFDVPETEKLRLLALYLNGLFNQSSKVAWIQDTEKKVGDSFQKSWFRETIYLPFETIELPVPVDYEKILTAYYGDWRTPVNDGESRKGVIYTADIPWREFLERVDFNLMLPKK